MTGPEGKSEFCLPRISMFPSTSSRETLRFSGNKIHCSPRDQSLSVKCCMVCLLLQAVPNIEMNQYPLCVRQLAYFPCNMPRKRTHKMAFSEYRLKWK